LKSVKQFLAHNEPCREQVSVIADSFHVVQNLNEAIHEARRKAQRKAKTEEEKNS